jgi:hypothetical protein
LPEYSGEYSVTVENKCGQSSDTIKVYSLRDVSIPNVVTINDDDRNEKLKIAMKEGPLHLLNTDVEIGGHLKIFNKWGNEIFSDQNYKNNWPLRSDDLEGVYYYTYSYGNCPAVKGWIQVIK